MEKRFNNFFDFWRTLKGGKLLVILAIIVTIITFCVLFINEDWTKWRSTEEDYQALEQVLDNMINEKNFVQPLSENFKSYSIIVNDNSIINLTLSGDYVTKLNVELDKDFKVISLKRTSESFLEVIFTFAIAFFMVTVLSYLKILIIYFILSLIFKIIKKFIFRS